MNLLYASPNVVITFANYMQFLFHYDESDKDNLYEHIRKLTEVMKAMRKDLGLSNKKLATQGELLMRAIIRDYDKKNYKQRLSPPHCINALDAYF